MEQIGAQLREAIGLDWESVGRSALHYAVRQRMAASATPDMADYARLLAASAEELQQLVNAVVVPETWFFRDPKAFAAMTERLATLPATRRPLRLLSLPCSTGEEPCSLAMAMLDAGFAPSDFTVDAVDVSTRNIAEAERGVYGRNSFRGTALAYRDRYFEPVPDGHRPRPEITQRIRYRYGNLFEMEAAVPYDVIFCRNLLIYFDRDRQQRALQRLYRLLGRDGLLLVGPAEASLPRLHGFAPVRAPMAFAFVKAEENMAPRGAAVPRAPVPAAAAPRPLPPRRLRPVAAPGRAPLPRGAFASAAGAQVAPVPAAAVARADAGQISLAAIEQAANEGRLAEARDAASRHMQAHGPSAQAFYLLGLVCDATGDAAEAEKSYRKALYLAADHREALAHLALLLRRQGAADAAAALDDRLQRIEKRAGR
nr:CheR family methyltransferase [Ancylobacter lacus]